MINGSFNLIIPKPNGPNILNVLPINYIKINLHMVITTLNFGIWKIEQFSVYIKNVICTTVHIIVKYVT